MSTLNLYERRYMKRGEPAAVRIYVAAKSLAEAVKIPAYPALDGLPCGFELEGTRKVAEITLVDTGVFYVGNYERLWFRPKIEGFYEGE